MPVTTSELVDDTASTSVIKEIIQLKAKEIYLKKKRRVLLEELNVSLDVF